MTITLARMAVGMATYMVLDGLWLGILMNGFYRERMDAIGRVTGNRFTPNWPAALVVYVLLGAGLALFAAPRATGTPSAAMSGALLGLVVYGVYDFTNFAMLRQWPIELTLLDTAWGVAASALAAVTVRAVVQ